MLDAFVDQSRLTLPKSDLHQCPRSYGNADFPISMSKCVRARRTDNSLE
jgi:hypothetical protein